MTPILNGHVILYWLRFSFEKKSLLFVLKYHFKRKSHKFSENRLCRLSQHIFKMDHNFCINTNNYCYLILITRFYVSSSLIRDHLQFYSVISLRCFYFHFLVQFSILFYANGKRKQSSNWYEPKKHHQNPKTTTTSNIKKLL